MFASTPVRRQKSSFACAIFLWRLFLVASLRISHGHLLGLTTLSPETFYTRDVSRQRAFYTTNPLHQRALYTRHLLHHKPFTSETFYTKHVLHQKSFTPETFYTRSRLHQRRFTPETFYTKRVLHHSPFTPQILCARGPFTPDSFLHHKASDTRNPVFPPDILETQRAWIAPFQPFQRYPGSQGGLKLQFEWGDELEATTAPASAYFLRFQSARFCGTIATLRAPAISQKHILCETSSQKIDLKYLMTHFVRDFLQKWNLC